MYYNHNGFTPITMFVSDMLHLFCVHISNFVINAIQSFASNFEFLVICLLLFLLCFIFYCFTLSFSHFRVFVFYALVSLHDIVVQCATIQCCVIQALIVHYVETLINHIFLIFIISILHSMHLKMWVFSLCLLCVFLAFQFASSFFTIVMRVERNME
jgi:hypothetical protein